MTPAACGTPLHLTLFVMGVVVGVLLTLGVAAALNAWIDGPDDTQAMVPPAILDGESVRMARILIDEEDSR